MMQVHGYSAFTSGSVFLPFVAMALLVGRLSGRICERFGAKVPLIVASLAVAAGLLLFALPGAEHGSYWISFFPAMVVQGFGMALAITPLTSVALGSVEGEHSGLASGVNNAVARVAGLMAVAVLGVLVYGAFSASLDARLEGMDMPARHPERDGSCEGGSRSGAGARGRGREYRSADRRRHREVLCRRVPVRDAGLCRARARQRTGCGASGRREESPLREWKSCSPGGPQRAGTTDCVPAGLGSSASPLQLASWWRVRIDPPRARGKGENDAPYRTYVKPTWRSCRGSAIGKSRHALCYPMTSAALRQSVSPSSLGRLVRRGLPAC